MKRSDGNGNAVFHKYYISIQTNTHYIQNFAYNFCVYLDYVSFKLILSMPMVAHIIKGAMWVVNKDIRKCVYVLSDFM